MEEMFTGLQHIGLPVKDFDQACEFYKLLGFSCEHSTRQPNGGKVAFYRLGNLQMEIYESDETAGRDGAIDHITLDCNDVEKAWDFAQKEGLPIISDSIEFLPYWDKGIKFFHVRAPAGEKVEFCERIRG